MKLIFAKIVVQQKSSFFVGNSFCESRPHMAALAKVTEAKCSYFDPLSFMCSPQPDENIAFRFKILVFSTPSPENALFHFAPSLN